MPADNTLSLSTLRVDGHVHIYPQYHWADAVNAMINNLTAALPAIEPQPKTIPIGLLTESKQGRFYREIFETGTPLIKGALQVEAGLEAGSLVIRDAEMIKGYLIAGRQLVTAEKLEVLALGKDTSLSDGLSLKEMVCAIRETGAIPVLSWSPGKWFFQRGKLVDSLITTLSPGSFLIGDIGLRPSLWPMPRLMKQADRRGFKIIAGSDSLPLAGEERWIGRTGFQVDGIFNPQQPATSLRDILNNPLSKFRPIGQHSSLMAFANRWGRNQLRSQEQLVSSHDWPIFSANSTAPNLRHSPRPVPPSPSDDTADVPS